MYLGMISPPECLQELDSRPSAAWLHGSRPSDRGDVEQ